MPISIDFCSWLYIIQMVVGLAGFVLFLWWLVKRGGRASAPYIYLMILLGAEGMKTSVELYARLMRPIDGRVVDSLLQSRMWEGRLVLPIIAMGLMLTHFLARVIKGK